MTGTPGATDPAAAAGWGVRARRVALAILGRAPFLLPGMVALLTGLWGGIIRLHWGFHPISAAWLTLHGHLMLSGFLGTLIGLERAVGIGKPAAFLGPALTAAGAICLVVGVLGPAPALLMTLGSLSLVGVSVVILRRQLTLVTVTLGLAALAWLAGNVLWLLDRHVSRFVLWWACFLVLTIAAERLELAKFRILGRQARRLFVATAAVILAGLLLSTVLHGPGVRVAGVGFMALSAWLLRNDIAWRTLREPRLGRFLALALLAGYPWLAIGGALLLCLGLPPTGMIYDAIIHTLFLGFVFSMIFAHAPLIFPAVMGVAMRFHHGFWAHLALLHASLILRVVSDLADWIPGRMWGGLLNAIAIALFLINTVIAILLARFAGETVPRG